MTTNIVFLIPMPPDARAGIWEPAQLRAVCRQITGRTVELMGFRNIDRFARGLPLAVTDIVVPTPVSQPSGTA